MRTKAAQTCSACASAGVLAAMILVGACTKTAGPTAAADAAPAGAADPVASPSTDATDAGSSDTALGAAFQPKPSPEKVQFLAAGNAICQTMNDQSAAITQQIGNDPSPDAAQQLFAQNGDLMSQAVAQLRALPQPPGDGALLAAMYADVDKLVDLDQQIGVALGQGDATRSAQLAGDSTPQQDATNQELAAYGLTECSVANAS